MLLRCKFLIRRCKFFEMCDRIGATSTASSTFTSPEGMVEDDGSMAALLYLQTILAGVTAEGDQQEFLACMNHLIAARARQFSHTSEASRQSEQGQSEQVQPQIHTREETMLIADDADGDLQAPASSYPARVDLSMSASQILPPRTANPSAHSVGPETWKRRTEVFEEILHFFPEEVKQPEDDLLSSAVTWEGVL